MLRGVLTRAAVAVFMIGTLLAPFGSCLSFNAKADHSCCKHAPVQDTTLQPNCCIVSATLPAAAVAPAVSDASPMAVVEGIVPVDELIVLRDFLTSTLMSPQSPPVGAFHLRI